MHPAVSSGSNKLSVTDRAQGFGKVIKPKVGLRAAFLEICRKYSRLLDDPSNGLLAQSKNSARLNQAQAAAYQPREGESKIPIEVCLQLAG